MNQIEKYTITQPVQEIYIPENAVFCHCCVLNDIINTWWIVEENDIRIIRKFYVYRTFEVIKEPDVEHLASAISAELNAEWHIFIKYER